MISSGKQYQNFEYYAKDPVYAVEDGRFIGGLPTELGFTEINADNMAKLQAGQDVTGKQLVETAGAGGVEHNPGKDYTFSIDKSISILRFSAETPEDIKMAIDEAMRAAGDKIVETAIKEGMVTWREHKGDNITHHAIENTDQIAARSFLQSTSRNNDPDLHVHIAFMNMAKVEDGYKTIKFDGIHKKDAKAFLDQTAKNEFYQVLEQKLGKDISNVIEKNKVDGTLSVVGIGKELIEQFSSRQTEIKSNAAVSAPLGIMVALAAPLDKDHRTSGSETATTEAPWRLRRSACSASSMPTKPKWAARSSATGALTSTKRPICSVSAKDPPSAKRLSRSWITSGRSASRWALTWP